MLRQAKRNREISLRFHKTGFAGQVQFPSSRSSSKPSLSLCESSPVISTPIGRNTGVILPLLRAPIEEMFEHVHKLQQHIGPV